MQNLCFICLRMRRTALILFWIVLFSAASCVDQAPRFTVPYARVYFEIDLNGRDSDLSFLDYKVFTHGRTVTEQTGYGGLLVFRAVEDNVFVYDLCCPYEDSKEVKVKPQKNGKAVCPKCGSVFVTMYGLGTPESGPSTEPLQRYTVNRKKHREGVFIVTN